MVLGKADECFLVSYRGERYLKESLLTIIAAVRENDDSILLAADSGIMDFGGLRDRLPYPKLNKLEGLAVAWGCSGNGTLGEEFNKALRTEAFSPVSWEDIQRTIVAKLGFLNGRQRDDTRRAGVNPTGDHTISCLFAGWIGEQPGIYEFDDQGRVASYWEQGFYAVGSGSYVAAIVEKTLRKVEATQLVKLKLLMEMVITSARGCEPPMIIWRITKNTISEVAVEQESNESGEPAIPAQG